MKQPRLNQKCLQDFLHHNLDAISTSNGLTSTERIERIFLLNNRSLTCLQSHEGPLSLVLQRTGSGVKVLKKWTIYIGGTKIRPLLSLIRSSDVCISLDSDGLGQDLLRKPITEIAKTLQDNSFVHRLDLTLAPTTIRSGPEKCLIKQFLFEIIDKTSHIRGLTSEFIPFLSMLNDESSIDLEYLDFQLNGCRRYLPPLLCLPIKHLRIQGAFIRYMAFSECHHRNPFIEKIEIDNTLENIGIPQFQTEFNRALKTFSTEISDKERIVMVRGPPFYEYGPISDLLDTIQINLCRADTLIQLASHSNIIIDSILIVGAASVDDIIISAWKTIVKDYIQHNFLNVDLISINENEARFILNSHTGTRIEFKINCTEIVDQFDDDWHYNV